MSNIERASERRGKGSMAEEVDIVDLNGEFHHKVDAKGRMSLPSAFRKLLSTDLVVTPNPKDECLYVFEAPEFNRWVAKAFEDKFGKYDSSNDLHVRLRRKLKSRAKAVEVDGAGRIMLSADQRTAAKIDKDVVVVGNTGYFEIWDSQAYEQENGDTDLGLLFG